MPYREYNEDDYEQEWENVVISKKETKVTNKEISNQVISDKEIVESIIKRRTSLQLSQLQLNQKCKFTYKYTIRDIESGKSKATLLELRKINLILDK
jgi:hypothetical protein